MGQEKKSVYTAAILWTVLLSAVVGFKVGRAAWQAPACDPNVDGPAACNTPGPIWNARDAQFPIGGQDADINVKGTGLLDNLTVRIQTLLQGPTNISGNLTVNALSTFTRDIAVNGAR
ncbi:MAG: hypothetical protein Q7S89_02260, partial [bacterium]|nr:hypothetical protein [bacterium]